MISFLTAGCVITMTNDNNLKNRIINLESKLEQMQLKINQLETTQQKLEDKITDMSNELAKLKDYINNKLPAALNDIYHGFRGMN